MEDNYPIKLSLPRRVWSQNEQRRAHWSVQRKERNWWLFLLAGALRGYRRAPDRRMLLIIISYRNRLVTDKANLIGGAKELVDAIKHVGLLKDDSDRWVEISYRQVQCPLVDERTEIVVQPDEPKF